MVKGKSIGGEGDFAFDDLVGDVVAIDRLTDPVVIFIVIIDVAVFPVEVLVVIEGGDFDEVVVVVVVIGCEGDEEFVGIVEAPFDAVAVVVVFVEVALHEFAVGVVEFHLGVVALAVVLIGTAFGHGAVGVVTLFLNETVVLVAGRLFFCHFVAEEDGAFDTVAIFVVQIGGAASEDFGAVVFVPAEGIAVDIEIIGIPSVFTILATEFVLEITPLVKGDRVDADELTTIVFATMEVIGVLDDVEGVAVDAHLLA